MKFFVLKNCALFFALLLLAFGCAQEPSESSHDNELMVVQAAQRVYYPTATAMNEEGSLWLIHHSHTGSGGTPQLGNYVAIEYTGELLPSSGGYVFRTTDSTKARQLGAFAYTTHFAPIFMQDTTTIQNSLYTALGSMQVGDTVKVLSASWLAFGSSGSTKWNGEASLPSNMPIVFTIVLKEVAANPKTRELDMVTGYVAQRNQGQTNLFVQPLNDDGDPYAGIYVKYDTVPHDSVPAYPTDGDSLQVKYAGFYLQDGFLLDANIDTIAQKYSWSTSDTTKYKAYYNHIYTEVPSGNYSVKAFDIALRNVPAGSWVEVVFTSDYGYGAAGNLANTSRPVYPYTPLRFKIFYAGKP